MIRKNFHLTETQIEGLETLYVQTGLPVAEHVRRAIDEYLEKMKGTKDKQPATAKK